MAGRLPGKVAIVTGATRGIGAAIATMFAAEGAAVVASGRDAALGAEVVGGIEAVGGEACFIAADVTDADAVEALVKGTVERYGRLTTLVNNAALTGPMLDDTPLAAMSLDTLERAVQVNLVGNVRVTQCALPHLLATGNASIVNVSSLAAHAGFSHAAYSASKGALDTVTRGLALAHARDGLRVNAVAPGVIQSSDTHVLLADPAFVTRVVDQIPLGRIGRPEDVAAACVFLASDEAAFITKVILPVNGGVFP